MKILKLFPGIILSAIIAVFAMWVESLLPIHLIGSAVIAMFVGMFLNKIISKTTIFAGGIKFTTPEFLYLMSQAIYQIGKSNNSAIAYISGVSDASSPYGDTISSQQLTKENYITVANNFTRGSNL